MLNNNKTCGPFAFERTEARNRMSFMRCMVAGAHPISNILDNTIIPWLVGDDAVAWILAIHAVMRLYSEPIAGITIIQFYNKRKKPASNTNPVVGGLNRLCFWLCAARADERSTYEQNTPDPFGLASIQ